MSDINPDTRLALHRFMAVPAGKDLLTFLRANPPASPIPVGGELQPHGVQVNYGFDLGVRATLDLIAQLAILPPSGDPEASPRLHDTRTL